MQLTLKMIKVYIDTKFFIILFYTLVCKFLNGKYTELFHKKNELLQKGGIAT